MSLHQGRLSHQSHQKTHWSNQIGFGDHDADRAPEPCVEGEEQAETVDPEGADGVAE